LTCVQGREGAVVSTIKPAVIEGTRLRGGSAKVAVQIAVLAAVAAGVVLFARLAARDGGRTLGANFEYDISAHSVIDPSLIIADEAALFSPAVKSPSCVAVDGMDRVWVGGAGELAAYDTEWREVGRCAIGGAARCLAVSESGDVFIGFSNRVDVLDSNLLFKTSWKVGGERAFVTSIAVDEGAVFVADAGNRTVWRTGPSGEGAARIGDRDEAAGEKGFVIPSPYFDLAVGRPGELWVVDPGRHELRNYTYEGRRRASWANSSMGVEGFCGCCNPTHIAVRPDGSFVTSEKGFVRVKIYDPAGNFRGVVAGPDMFEDHARGLDLASDSSGRIFVLDPAREQVRVFVEKDR